MQSQKVLRIIRISQKYNKRPSEILGLDDEYTSFCFDEAIEHILSFRKYNENSNKEEWSIEPKWNDIEVEKIKRNNNSALINEMLENLKEIS